jgi:HK97 gp10 family phage protein
MKATVKVEGLKDLESALSELPKLTRRNAGKRALMKAAQPMFEEAQRRAPELTGYLKTHFYIGRPLSPRQKRLQRGANKPDVEIFLGPDSAKRGVMQEFGTQNHAPQPFMRPAFDNNVWKAIGTIKEILSEEIMKAARRVARKAARRARAGGG